MPISPSHITTANVFPAALDEPIAAILARLPTEHSQRVLAFVVLPVSARSYRVVQWQQVEQLAHAAGGDLRSTAIGTLPGLPAPVPAVEMSSNQQDALELRDEQRPLKVLVVLQNGAFHGLLLRADRANVEPGPDPFEINTSALPPLLLTGPDSEEAAPQAQPQPEAEDDRTSALPPLVLTDPDSEEAAPQAQPQPEAEDDRVINAWIDDSSVKGGAPLQVGESYELKFSIESARKGVLGTATFDAKKIFNDPNLAQVEVTVVLDSDDFEIIGEDQGSIVVPRTGKSRKNATFTVAPKQNGLGEIRALFFANNRVFQKMKLSIQVGAVAAQAAPVATQTSGKTFASAFVSAALAQEVDLVILKKDAGYEFILNSGGFKRALVNLSEQQIADLSAGAREQLKQIVYTKDGASFAYQSANTNVAAPIHAQTLKTLQRLGFKLFEALFFAPGSGSDANEMGRLLREKSKAGKLQVAIIAERFTFPWALLYDRDFNPNQVDPEGFWGFKHVIEYTPEFRSATVVKFSPEITVTDTLEMGFVVNTTIDDELQRKGATVQVIKPQQDFLKALAGVKVTEYPTSGDLFKLLNDATGKTQFIYFYCHAEGALPGAPGGVDASKILLSDGPVTLEDLKLAAPLSGPSLDSCPLVFLNACESAELSPYLYDGLVPYLIAKGARGVIGTEVNTPALFAAEFAQALLTQFIAGDQPLGELLLQLRRTYLNEKNNVMGLVYALHSGAGVVVRRG